MTAVHNFQGLSWQVQGRFVWLAVSEEAKQHPGSQVNVYCRDIFFLLNVK